MFPKLNWLSCNILITYLLFSKSFKFLLQKTKSVPNMGDGKRKKKDDES